MLLQHAESCPSKEGAWREKETRTACPPGGTESPEQGRGTGSDAPDLKGSGVSEQSQMLLPGEDSMVLPRRGMDGVSVAVWPPCLRDEYRGSVFSLVQLGKPLYLPAQQSEGLDGALLEK